MALIVQAEKLLFLIHRVHKIIRLYSVLKKVLLELIRLKPFLMQLIKDMLISLNGLLYLMIHLRQMQIVMKKIILILRQLITVKDLEYILL